MTCWRAALWHGGEIAPRVRAMPRRSRSTHLKTLAAAPRVPTNEREVYYLPRLALGGKSGVKPVLSEVAPLGIFPTPFGLALDCAALPTSAHPAPSAGLIECSAI